jgi:apolipoprotein N-acyltransferase
MSRVDADHGAQVIIYQTSDSTFQGSWALEQHASLSAVRAAETGRPVVQAALTGDSAAFDERGRLVGWAGSSDRGALTVSLGLPAASARTPYDRLGDYVPWSAAAIALLAAAIAMTRGARERHKGIHPDRPADIPLERNRGPGRPTPAADGAQLTAPAGKSAEPGGDAAPASRKEP